MIGSDAVYYLNNQYLRQRKVLHELITFRYTSMMPKIKKLAGFPSNFRGKCKKYHVQLSIYI